MARKKLPRGIREKGSAYEARAIVNGIKINLYNSNLDELIVAFEDAKEQARMRADYRKNDMTLNEWFEEWFENVKSHRVKETSIAPMKRSYKRTFGFYIGNMKLNKIRPMHIPVSYTHLDVYKRQSVHQRRLGPAHTSSVTAEPRAS